MKIEIDLARLEKLGLKPDEYVALMLKVRGETTSISLSVRRSYLQTEGYLKMTEQDFDLRERAYELFEISEPDKCWIELFLAFPMKVEGRTGGSRPLRASSLDAKSNELPKKKYLTIIKNKPELHKHIIKVLEAEVEMRRNSSTLQFMNALEVWINQKNWEKYEYLLKEKEEKSGEEGYGGRLI